MSWVGAIFCSLGTKPAIRELLGIATAIDFRSMVLPSARDLETIALTSSPIPINLFTIIALRTRFMNLARVTDTSAPGSEDDGGVINDATGGASDWRQLVSSEFRSSLRPSWNRTTGWVGDTGPVLGAIILVLGRMIGPAYSGGIDSTLSTPDLRPNITFIRLKATVACRTIWAPQVRAVFFIHLL